MYFEYGGGLGDVIMRAYRGQYYRQLNRAKDGDELVIISHNPYCIELFQGHPNFSRLKVRLLPYWGPDEDAAKRAEYGLPPAVAIPDVSDQDGMDFYPLPQDAAELVKFQAIDKPAVAVCPTAGLPFRDIPFHLADRFVSLILDAGATPVLLGRDYERFGRRECMADYQREGVVNLVNRLSAPAACLVVKRCLAIVTCHSAMNAVAWQERKPQLLLYPEQTRLWHFLRRDQWSFGMHYPETFQATLGDDYGVEIAVDNFFCRLRELVKKTDFDVVQLPYPESCRGIKLAYDGPRFTQPHDVRPLIETISRYPGDIVEIGANRGQTTLELAVAFPDRRIWAVEYPWAPMVAQQDGERVPGDWVCDHARHLKNVVTVLKPFHECPPEIFAGAGVVFVDGDHSYHGCNRDTVASVRLLGGKGLIAWHDYYEGAPDWVGVKEVVTRRAMAGGKVWSLKDTWLAFEDLGG